MDGEQITQEELDEIERLDREATPGPWEDADGFLLMAIFSQGAWREPSEADEKFSLRARSLLPRLARSYRKACAERDSGILTADLVAQAVAKAESEAYARGRREAIEAIEEEARDLAQSGLVNDAAALRRVVQKLKDDDQEEKELSNGR